MIISGEDFTFPNTARTCLAIIEAFATFWPEHVVSYVDKPTLLLLLSTRAQVRHTEAFVFKTAAVQRALEMGEFEFKDVVNLLILEQLITLVVDNTEGELGQILAHIQKAQ